MKPFIHPSKNRRHNFNLIEVALAMGVIGITFGTLMNVIPVASLTSQKTLAENSSAVLISTIKTMLDHDYLMADSLEAFVLDSNLVHKGSFTFSSTMPGDDADYQAPKLEELSPDKISGKSLVQDLGDVPFIGRGNGAMYQTDAMSIHMIKKGLLAVRMGPDEDRPDFAAFIRIWAMPIAKNESMYVPLVYRSKKTESPQDAQEKNLYSNLYKSSENRFIPTNEMLTIAVEIIYPVNAISKNAEGPEGNSKEDSTVDATDWSLRYAQIKSFSFKYTMKEIK